MATDPGWQGLYELSSAGRVRSVARVVETEGGCRRRVPGRLLKLSAGVGRSPHVTLSRGRRRVTFYPSAGGGWW